MFRWLADRMAASRLQNTTVSISDPRAADLFADLGWSLPSEAGVTVNEGTAMGISAVYRAVALVAGTVAMLPLRSLRDTGDDMRQRVRSFLDDPGARAPIAMTAYSWKETVLAHLLLHGNAFLRHIYGGAGQLIALEPVHPLLVGVRLPLPDDAVQPLGGKWFDLTLSDGRQLHLDKAGMTHIPGLSLDGVSGVSVITLARHGFGAAIAADRSAARTFSKGALIAGMLTPTDDDLEADEAKVIRGEIDRRISGWENAGTVPVINRRLTFTPWTMNYRDAQWLESRQFTVRDVARWFGIPPHLLMETSAASNWGTGIEQQNLGLARFNLVGWTSRVEQALSQLLPNPVFVEFDFAGLERPDPATEIDLLIRQVQAGLLTLDEARAIRNLPPLDLAPPVPEPSPAPEGDPA